MEYADLGPASEAAKKFRATIVLAWTKLDAWSVNKRVITDHTGDGESVQLMHRGSLVSVLRGELYSADHVATVAPDTKWRTTKEGREAYFRRIVDVTNRPSAILGMRFELLGQLNVPPPEGATDQRSFRQLGLRYGVFTEGLNVPDRMNRGRVRLAILSPELVDELLGEPASGDDAAGAVDDLGRLGDAEYAAASPVASPEITTNEANG